MKKILRTVLIAVLIIVAAIAVAAYFLFFHEGKIDDVRSTVTDPSGNTYVAITEDDKDVAVVTDEDGNRWAVEIKDDGSLGTTGKNLNDSFSEKDVISNYTGPTINETVDPSAYTGSVSQESGTTKTTDTAPSSTAPSGSSAQGTTGGQTASTQPSTQVDSSTSNILKYQQMFSSGTYYMKFTTNDKEMGDNPIVAAAKNGNILITSTIEKMNCAVLYLANKDKTYLILYDYKKYCSVPKSMFGDDFDMNEMNLMSGFAEEINPNAISTDTVSIDGKSLTRESYTLADGTTMSYYFEGGTLVRLDNDPGDGTAVIETYISEITSDVPDSTFDVPKGYGYLNLSWLDIF